MRESSTGAKAGTFPKDGENIRSSKLSEDLAQATRKWPTDTSSGRIPAIADMSRGGLVIACSVKPHNRRIIRRIILVAVTSFS